MTPPPPSEKGALRFHAPEACAASSSKAPQRDHATITSAVAADPKLPPSQAAKLLFPSPPAWRRAILRSKIKEQLEEGRGRHWNWHRGAVHESNKEPGDEELEAIRGRFGYKAEAEGGPSRLYLMMLADACLPLPRHPMSGVVSPPLLATTGIVPFSIFSTGPDIVGHYYDCIVAARQEVVLLTNYWQLGKNVDKVTEALRELNRRHEERRRRALQLESKGANGGGGSADADTLPKPTLKDQIVVKIMWDRGPRTLADLFRLRKPVPPGMWKANGLPEEREVPYLNIEVLNYHRPLMGTFHAKLLLVDRKVALINSNNIQDRPNIEACARLEGDIVNSVYDHALISWGNRLRPPLPCLSSPAPAEPSAYAFQSGAEGSTLPDLTADQLRVAADKARQQLSREDEETEIMTPTNNRRLSFADVVDDVLLRTTGKVQHHQQQQQGSLAGAGQGGISTSAGDGGATRTAAAGEGTPGADAEAARSEAEKARLARHAGALWAHKVLGERFHGGFGGGAGGGSSASHRQGGGPTASTATQTTDDDRLLSPVSHQRRHFGELIEAEMKRRGIQPGYWTEGALEVLGLGPSSSRNVAEEVRRSRAARGQPRDAASRGISVPQAVSEEVAAGSTAAPPAAAASNGVAKEHVGEALEDSVIALSDTVVDAGEGELTTAPAFDGKNSSAEAQTSKQGASADGAGMQPVGLADDNDHAVKRLSGGAPKSTPARPADAAPKRLGSSSGDGSTPSDSPARRHSPLAGDDENDDDKNDAGNKPGGDGDDAPGASAYRRHRRRTASTLSKTSASERLAKITQSLDFANLSQVRGGITAEQLEKVDAGLRDAALVADDVLDFSPFIFHEPHAPVPIALVNRRPHGTPGHNDIRNAQDAAWLAGFRYAKRHIFIQTPTLNATPIKHAVLHACRRHVRVELWLGLGFNQRAESFWFQGGPNDLVTSRLYRQLRREGRGDEKYLEIYWYTGKDMTRPLNAARKQRNCHVKYAEFDGEVAIIGSGNQDTQSWFHSQEINVMVDSRRIVAEWSHRLRRNQSTALYGRIDPKTGVWSGPRGEEADTGKDE